MAATKANGAELDRRLMAAALRLGRRNLGETAPNPAVGALIVENVDGQPIIVGRGSTAVGGRPHAEMVALRRAGERARGATAYVTLEPCSHHGETPPCSAALMRRGWPRRDGGRGSRPSRRRAGGRSSKRQASR